MSRAARVTVRAGVALLVLGVLLIAFVAYQLWGTALYEARAQDGLKSELAHQLHHSLPTTPARLDGTQQFGLPPLARHTVSPLPPPAAGQPVGLLSIPKIDILDAIVEGVGEAQLQQGPGHYPGTPLPGQPGNVSIAGHRTTYAHPFYNLDALSPGDNIYILTRQGLFQYTVSGNQIVPPTDVSVLDTVTGHSTLTLTTCNPRYSAATRLVVTADFDGQTAAPSATTPTTRPPVTQLAGESGTAGSLGGSSSPVTPAILWALLTVVVAVGITLLWRHIRGRLRIILVVAAIPAIGLPLLVCFEHVSLALPGSF